MFPHIIVSTGPASFSEELDINTVTSDDDVSEKEGVAGHQERIRPEEVCPQRRGRDQVMGT